MGGVSSLAVCGRGTEGAGGIPSCSAADGEALAWEDVKGEIAEDEG